MNISSARTLTWVLELNDNEMAVLMNYLNNKTFTDPSDQFVLDNIRKMINEHEHQ